jgi:hypothetical protein
LIVERGQRKERKKKNTQRWFQNGNDLAVAKDGHEEAELPGFFLPGFKAPANIFLATAPTRLNRANE